MKVLMLPHVTDFADPGSEGGIRRVVEAYFKHLPKFGVELVNKDATSYDLVATHAGLGGGICDVCICHGLYWTSDYDASQWEYKANVNVIDAVRHAREVTVPSSWVAEAFQRDMHLTPNVVPHGIDWREWAHNHQHEGYILWNKNRRGDVCTVEPLERLASQFSDTRFVSTMPVNLPNVAATGVVPHAQMKEIVQKAFVYLSTTKETFGIGVLEALASGVPVLGFRQGGNVDIIQHGVTGYLAEPGNMDDLADGLQYCAQYRDTLSRNAVLSVRSWTWEVACEKLAGVFEKAMVVEPPTAAIIIPSFNYGKLVGSAIESAMRQDYGHLTDIIVVDDGSSDDGLTERVVKEYLDKDNRIKYIRQDNSGVSIARNTGIASTDVKYICCLDADDQLAPTFLSKLIPHLENDRSLGLVYSGLKLLLPRGDEILELGSNWPNECNFDEQVIGRNQVPTCNVFRREAWEQLGGYRQRYCPTGAGTEDAEFWLRVGAFGWGIKQATKEPLFYYLLGGRTSGDKDYKEINYLQWHPWTSDGQHPFASIATPGNLSHKVRQYDEPIVSVIVPVGPGHEKDIVDALDSLEAQYFRKWEAIVVDDTGDDKLDLTGFPFARVVKTEGKKGAGYARNRGVEIARGKLLLFLDADDWFYPDAIYKMVEEYIYQGDEVGVYGDHNGLVVISEEYAQKMDDEHRLLQYRPSDGHALVRFFNPEYSQEKAIRQPSSDGNFYLWCYVSTLIPRSWHDEVGGFDENMESWEDWDYYLRMARLGKCFVHVREPFLVYRFYSGSRRWAAHPDHEKGLLLARNLVQYMVEKYREFNGGQVVMCKGCGGSSNRRAMDNYRDLLAKTTSDQSAKRIDDKEFVLCEYLGVPPGNVSEHNVIGAYVFPSMIDGAPMIGSRGGYQIDYRYKKAGDRFLVHKKDIELSPHWFHPVELDKRDFQSVLPKQSLTPPPEPQSLAEVIEKSVIVPGNGGNEKDSTQLGMGIGDIVPPSVVEEKGSVNATADVSDAPITEKEAVSSMMADVLQRNDIEALAGVTPSIAEQMLEDGITSYNQILKMGVDGLKKYRGVADARANLIIDCIRGMQLAVQG